MSVFLMFVILAVATDTRAVGEAAAIAIGGTIGLDAMFGGPISGASMNPMRSLGPDEKRDCRQRPVWMIERRQRATVEGMGEAGSTPNPRRRYRRYFGALPARATSQQVRCCSRKEMFLF